MGIPPSQISAPDASRRLLLDTDPCESEINIQPWNLLVAPWRSPEFRVERDCLVTPNLLLYIESFSHGVTMVGQSPPGCLSIVIPLKNAEDSCFFRRVPRTGELLAGFDSCVDAQFRSGQSNLVLILDRAFLEAIFSQEEMEALAQRVERFWVNLLPREKRELVLDLLGLMHRTREHRELLSTPGYLEAAEVDVAHWVMNKFNDAPPASGSGNRQHRQRGFAQALEYLDTSIRAGVYPTISEVTQEAGVSQRTLEYVFRERLGMTPLAYLKRQKYHGLRRALLHSGDDYTVQELAMRLGLFEMGRVAGEYRGLFGENPSQTKRADRLGHLRPLRLTGLDALFPGIL